MRESMLVDFIVRVCEYEGKREKCVHIVCLCECVCACVCLCVRGQGVDDLINQIIVFRLRTFLYVHFIGIGREQRVNLKKVKV